MSDKDSDESDLKPLTEPLAVRDGVLTLWGWGVKLSVRDRHLVVSDGVGGDRTLRIAKGVAASGTAKLKRVVILAESGGMLTLDALDWLRDAGAALIILDRKGDVREAFGARRIDDVRLRRTQALAPVTGLGPDIIRLVLSQKLSGQAESLTRLAHSAPGGGAPFVDTSIVEALRAAATSVAQAPTAALAIETEAGAAGLYWAVLAPLELRFATRDSKRVPDHWKRVGLRQSGLGNTPRRATTPAHALWNFGYALLEAETTIALMGAGLDPGMGVLHADVPLRNSFALDVMEAVRGTVDAFVINLLLDHVWRYVDVVELVAGDCRLAPALAFRVSRELHVRQAVENVVSKVVHLILAGYGRKADMGRIVPALQVRDRFDMSPAKSALKSRAMKITRATQSASAIVKDRRCLDCGANIGMSRAKSCPTCRPERILVQRDRTFAKFQGSGAKRLAELRKSGRDPTNTPEASAQKAKKNATHYRLNAAWADDGSLEGVDFTRDILPLIVNLSIGRIAKMMGLSQAYCSHVRSGKVVPHRRHWKTLLTLIERKYTVTTDEA